MLRKKFNLIVILKTGVFLAMLFNCYKLQVAG